MNLTNMRITLPISVIVLTFNEEANIAECLESVNAWADEIFVVDSGSTDQTIEIAKQYSDKIFTHEFVNYAAQRNWAQDNLPLSHEWVFHLDADERVTPELAKAISRFFADGPAVQVNGAMASRRTVFMGRWIRYGGHYPVYHTRLFRREKGRCEERQYDQHFLVHPQIVKLSGDIIDILTTDLDRWSQRHIRWAALEAQELLHDQAENERGQVKARLVGSPVEQRRWLRTRLFGRVPPFSRAFAYFLYRYVFRLGFLDGTAGLVFHFLHACWFRFYTDAKVWEIRKQTSNLKPDDSFQYRPN